MDVFDLFGKIGIDTSEYEQGLSKASGLTKTASKSLSAKTVAAGKMIADFTEKAVGKMVDFGKSTIDVGASFDTSMSQVAATMGKTVDQLEDSIGTANVRGAEFQGNLRDFAKFVGEKTEYSATQAADALNYMALAGYNTQQSMDMLPNVLNLASAGQMDMAKASDMVTDAQTAFGLSAEQTTTMVNQMAKTASTTNTNVEQLGEAFLTVGANARSIKGGTAEVSQVLGILADNGIKASEGGTHLRNIMKRFAKPTKDSAAAMKELGVNAYDSEGNLRSMEDIFLQIADAEKDMTNHQKDVINTKLFNGYDLAAVNSLLGTTKERWDEVSDAIASSNDDGGAAAKMAETQIDNLNGDVTLFKSALEAVQIAISDGTSPALRDFVQIGTQGLSDLASALNEGSFDKAMKAITDTISSAIDKFNSYLPQILEAGTKIAGAIATGIVSNLPTVITTVSDMLTQVLTYISTNADAIMQGGADIISALGNGIISNLPSLTNAVVQLLTAFVTYISDNQEQIMAGAQTLINALMNAIITLAPALAESGGVLVGTIGSAIITNIPLIVEQLPTFVAGVMQGLNEAFVNASPAGKVAIATVFAGMIGDGINSAVKVIPSLISGISTYFSNIGKFMGVLGNIGGAIKKVISIMVQIPGAIGPTITLVKTFVSLNVVPVLQSIGSTIATVFTTIVSTGGSLLTLIKTFFSLNVIPVFQSIGTVLTGTVLPAIVPFLPLIAGVTAAVVGIILVIKNWGKISEWLGEVHAKLKSTIDGALSKIKDSYSKHGKGIKGVIGVMWDGIKAYWKAGFNVLDKLTGGKLSALVSKFKAGLQKPLKILGGQSIAGLWDGMKVKLDWLQGKIQSAGKKIVGFFKKAFKIGSPSKVMRDEVGVFLAQGVAQGIEKDAKKAVASADKLAKSVVKKAKDVVLKSTKSSDNLANSIYGSIDKTETKSVKVGKKTTKKTVNRSRDDVNDDLLKEANSRAKKLKDANKLTEQQEASFWVSIAKKAGKGSDAYNTAMAKANKVRKQSQADRLEKAKNDLQEYENLHDVSAKYEEEYWNKIRKTFKKGSKERISADKEYSKAVANVNKEKLDSYSDYVSNYSALHDGEEMTAKEQMDYWQKAKGDFKKGTDEWITAQTNYLNKRKELMDSEKSANDNLKTSLQNAEQTYQQAIQATIDKLNDRKQALLQQFGLFQKFDAGEAVAGSTLLSNIDSQVKGLKEWEEQIAALKKRMGNTDLFKAIQEQGASGLNEVIALNAMTDEELQTYSNQYEKLDTLAEKQAKKELGGTIKKDEQKALKDYMQSVSDAWKSYQSTMSELGVSVKKIPKSVKNSLKKVGKDYADVLDTMKYSTENKISAVASTLKNGFKKISGSTKKYGEDLMDNFIKGINSKEKNLSKAVIEKIAKQVKKYIGFSEPEAGPLSNFHTFAPDMIDLFVKGISENGARIGQAFDDNLGIEDISGRIAESMAVPQNTVGFAGIPGLTEMGGQSRQSGPTTLNITMQVDKTAFAKLVYQMNRAEKQRVGVNLATGVI